MTKIELFILLAVLIGIGFPSLAFMFFSRLFSNNPLVLFLFGVLLVLIAAWGFQGLSSLQEAISNLPAAKEQIAKLELQRQIWLFLFPGVALGVGINLMSTAITSKPASIPSWKLQLLVWKMQQIALNHR